MPRGHTPLTLHTLGPEGTNCAEAARLWLSRHDDAGAVVLHRTLEDACAAITDPTAERLLSCAAYPDLHTLIFSRLDQLMLIDSFIMPTHSMVLASQAATTIVKTVATHPAPQRLSGANVSRIMATSNADAAVRCANGETDGCITTIVAARHHGLSIREDFGPVPMAFLVHAPL